MLQTSIPQSTRTDNQAQPPGHAGNEAARTGAFGCSFQKILESLKPEAAYFTTGASGERGGFIVFDMKETSQLHLPVQIHTSVGGGDYYFVQDSSVMGLENVLRDPRYENVVFDLLHGGYPHEREAIWLAARKNVYLDSSLMGIFVYPDQLHHILRRWLELFPDKIVFGSDTFPLSETIGAEEGYWLATKSARTALAAALAEMVSEHEISEAQALDMARAYLHDTAARIYSPEK